MKNKYKLILGLLLAAPLSQTVAVDWPTWGRDNTRNFYSPESGIVGDFEPGKFKRRTEDVDLTTAKNVKWVAKLGSQAYGNTTVAGGKIYVGTNNETPRDLKHKGDRGVVYCFDEKTGQFLWQLVVPKLGAGKVSDWEFLGICSSPAIEGNRVYLVSNRCEILCLDTEGLANGNDGIFQEEGEYLAGTGNPPMEPSATDADIIWRFDMREELGVFPHNIASSSVLIMGDKIVATTSNGQDWSHLNIPNESAPCLVVLDKETGMLAGEEASGISENLMHCNWSSPSFGSISGQKTIVFGAGDGLCYGFDPVTVKDEDGFDILKELWRIDAVPAAYKEHKYPHHDGPSEIISTPVVYKNHVYVAIGQDPEHGEGVGNLICIDPTKGSGDLTGKEIWSYKGLHRTISTPSIDPKTDLLFIGDYSGFVYCLDAKTGEEYWKYDMKAHMWGSTLVADGKVFIGDEDGDFVIIPAIKNPERDARGRVKPSFETYFPAPVYSTPIVANGVLYVATQSHLYAIAK